MTPAYRGIVDRSGDVWLWPTVLWDHNEAFAAWPPLGRDYTARFRQWEAGGRVEFDQPTPTPDEVERVHRAIEGASGVAPKLPGRW